MSETVTQNEKPSKFISTVLFTCSGISNTGKLTDIAASTLSFRRPDLFRAIPAKKGVESLEDAKKEGELIFVVDGCEEHCAKKKLDGAGIEADMQVVLTQIGIKKTNPSDIKSEYVEQAICVLNNAVKFMQK
jgi:uncharacterized metal-binding protein